jgi:hypothetical protein
MATITTTITKQFNLTLNEEEAKAVLSKLTTFNILDKEKNPDLNDFITPIVKLLDNELKEWAGYTI